VTALHGQVADLTARVVELDRTQTHMATRLERIIFSLHNGFVDKKYVSLPAPAASQMSFLSSIYSACGS
jgi:hypothetical protein